ncbi:MAG: hypothetical protein AAFP00_03205, partial [Bacteroidota bacterium]
MSKNRKWNRWWLISTNGTLALARRWYVGTGQMASKPSDAMPSTKKTSAAPFPLYVVSELRSPQSISFL